MNARRRGQASKRRDANPDFVPSLRLLICRERYSWTDIALMFGVTRERVHQWARAYNIEHPDARESRGLRAVRVWNDARNRFEPVRKTIVREAAVQNRKAARLRYRGAKRAAIVEAARTVQARTGPGVTWAEIATQYRGRAYSNGAGIAYLLAAWGGASCTNAEARRREYANMRATLEASGVVCAGVGGAGHRAKRAGVSRVALQHIDSARKAF